MNSSTSLWFINHCATAKEGYVIKFSGPPLAGPGLECMQERCVSLSGKKAIGQQQLLEAETELIRLATGGDRSAFYDLEPAQLCGQINSAAQMALAYPDRHPALLRFLAPEADETDIQIIVQHAQLTPEQKQNASIDPVLDARNRVTYHLQRSIDALQIAMSFRWKFCLQIVIYAVCFILSFVCLLAVKRGPYTVGEAIAVAVVAGFLSPVISDFASTVNRWRKP